MSEKFKISNLDLYYGDFHALKDINMSIHANEITAFIGPSGCGKSTFLKSLNRMNDLVEGCKITGNVLLDGEDIYKGMDVNLLRKRVGMVFQKPNPFPMSIYDNIAYGPRTHGIRSKAKLDEIVEKSLRDAAIWDEVKDRLKKSAFGMSGGQRQRVAIARALALEPEIVVLDEATSALDVSVQKTVIELITKLQREKNITFGFICHDIALVQLVAHQVAVMYLGNLVEVLPGKDLDMKAMHPYTRALMGAVFDINMDFSKPIESIESEAPSPLDLPQGCPFQGRCEHCMDICKKENPKLVEVEDGHSVACHLFQKGSK